MNEQTKLYTVLLSFSDHLVGVGQYEAKSPHEALQKFFELNESLEGCDRATLARFLLLDSLMLIRGLKGFWMIASFPNPSNFKWPDDNPVLGGHVIQSDLEGPLG